MWGKGAGGDLIPRLFLSEQRCCDGMWSLNGVQGVIQSIEMRIGYLSKGNRESPVYNEGGKCLSGYGSTYCTKTRVRQSKRLKQTSGRLCEKRPVVVNE